MSAVSSSLRLPRATDPAAKVWQLATDNWQLLPASRLVDRPRPAMVPTGVAAVDALTGGLPRGGLTKICGAASSGKTSLLLAAMAAATARGEVCALVDVGDCFDPASAQAAGVDLKRVLWVRCSSQLSVAGSQRSGQWAVASGQRRSAIGNRHSALKQYSAIEQGLKATDLLLQAGGFGMVVMDMGDVPAQAARRVPLTSWFRFRRAVEHTDTVLLAVTREACARSCAGLVLQLSASGQWPVVSGHSLPNADCRMPNKSGPWSVTSGQQGILDTGLRRTAQGQNKLFTCHPEGERSEPEGPMYFVEQGKCIGPSSGSRPPQDDSQESADHRPLATDHFRKLIPHARLMEGLDVRIEVLRDAVQGKKPVQSAARFASETEWKRNIG